MQNYFPSLNAALESENLVDVWPLGANLSYGDTIGLAVNGQWISIYRDETGRYERPVRYATQMADTGIIHLS